MVYGKENEKPTTLKARIAIIAVWWVIGTPLLVGLWFLFGWWVLVLAAVGVWATIDYLRRGQQLDQVTDLHTGCGDVARQPAARAEDSTQRAAPPATVVSACSQFG